MKSKVLIGVPFFNEEHTISSLLIRFRNLSFNTPHSILFINDGSTDNSKRIVLNFLSQNKTNIILQSNEQNCGIGYSIKKIINFGLQEKFDICVIMAGNGKDDPSEIEKIIDPIIKEDYDYIQGSRFLKGGSFKNLPFLRKMMIWGFTFIFKMFTSFKSTDSSNGFRAYKLSLFSNKKINIDQEWLDRYELETYLHYKVITLGYKIKEVAVSKNYLPNVKNYSKIRPVFDWWKMIRPIFLLKLGIKD